METNDIQQLVDTLNYLKRELDSRCNNGHQWENDRMLLDAVNTALEKHNKYCRALDKIKLCIEHSPNGVLDLSRCSLIFDVVKNALSD